jgi:hypothetical protein
MTNKSIENDQKSKEFPIKVARGILTNTERAYLMSNRWNSSKEHVIKIKTKRTLNEDLPLLSSLRPDYLAVRTYHKVTKRIDHQLVDTNIEDELISLKIFDERLIDASVTLYRLNEEQIQEERISAKSKMKVAEKEVWKKVNGVIKIAKTKVRKQNSFIQDYKKRQKLVTK